MKELRWTVTDERMTPAVSRIIPGDWGKVRAGWLLLLLLRLHRKVGRAEAGFTSSSGNVRALSVIREIGTERRGTMRNRSKPSQVARVSFESERIAVTQRV